MKTASTIARYLLGVIFFVFGLNGFLNFMPMPLPPGIAGQFFMALGASHYFVVVFLVEVAGGVLLLAGRYVPLALAIIAPVVVNILCFHAFMEPSGLPMAMIVLVLWLLAVHNVRSAFSGLFQRSARPTVLSETL